MDEDEEEVHKEYGRMGVEGRLNTRAERSVNDKKGKRTMKRNNKKRGGRKVKKKAKWEEIMDEEKEGNVKKEKKD